MRGELRLVRTQPCSALLRLHSILQIPFPLTDELERKEKSAVCFLRYHVFLVLKHLSFLSGKAVVSLGFFKMFYCLSLNES